MGQYIAIDLGAESGRIIVGRLSGNKLKLEEAYRFANGPVNAGGNLYWDALRFLNEIKIGLRKTVSQSRGEWDSIAVDSWGVDFALLDCNDQLLGNPFSHRDRRTDGMMEAVFAKVPRAEIYRLSGGIGFMPINTLYQIYSMVVDRSPQLTAARTFLMIADLINFWITGVKTCEYTNATTTQFYNTPSNDWSNKLLETLGLPTDIFPDVIKPGTVIADLSSEISSDIGLSQQKSISVVAPATHDTASAAAAVPARDSRIAWISSGTWSLLGGIHNEALVNDQALAHNFSSFGGPRGNCMPWTNIMGLWLVQECRRIWERSGDKFSYEQLVALATDAEPFLSHVDPDDTVFLAPSNMVDSLRQYCKESNQSVPDTVGEITRVALESLALKYRWCIENLASLLEVRLSTIHIVGGGSRNRLLCQLTADATQLPVVAGPVEATAIGNIVVQAMSKGELSSFDEVGDLIRASFGLDTYEPHFDPRWDETYESFKKLVVNNGDVYNN